MQCFVMMHVKFQVKSSDGDQTAFKEWSDPGLGWSGPGPILGLAVRSAIRIRDLAFIVGVSE